MTSARLTGIGGIITIGLGIMMYLTNPGSQSYQKYADRALEARLQKEVCDREALELGEWLKAYCHTLISTASPQLAKVVSQQTKRQNFILFSIYQTDLPTPTPFPDYHIETIGILGNFFTYQAEEL